MKNEFHEIRGFLQKCTQTAACAVSFPKKPENVSFLSHTPYRSRAGTLTVAALWTLAMVLLAATLTGRWGRHSAAVEVFANFPLQYLLAGFVLLVLALLFHSRSWLPAAAAVAINGGVLLPFMPYESVRSQPPVWPHLRVMTANVLYNNANYRGVCRAISRVHPDVVVMQEVTPAFRQYFKQYFQQRYLYYAEIPSKDGNVVLAASRLPMRQDTSKLALTGLLHAIVKTRSDSVEFYSVHPKTPLTPATHNARSLSMNHLFGQAHNKERPTVVLGDFNIGAFTPLFLEMETTSYFRSLRRGRGLYPTFNARTPVAFQIPIDHILINPFLRGTAFERVPLPGSDHRALWADLVIERRNARIKAWQERF